MSECSLWVWWVGALPLAGGPKAGFFLHGDQEEQVSGELCQQPCGGASSVWTLPLPGSGEVLSVQGNHGMGQAGALSHWKRQEGSSAGGLYRLGYHKGGAAGALCHSGHHQAGLVWGYHGIEEVGWGWKAQVGVRSPPWWAPGRPSPPGRVLGTAAAWARPLRGSWPDPLWKFGWETLRTLRERSGQQHHMAAQQGEGNWLCNSAIGLIPRRGMVIVPMLQDACCDS